MLFVGGAGSLVGKSWQTQAQSKIEKLMDYSNWWLGFYTWSQNVQLQAIQEFIIGSKKDFIYGWQIHERNVVNNSFDSMFTKWLMRREDIDLGWVIAKTCLHALPMNTIFSIFKNVGCVALIFLYLTRKKKHVVSFYNV